MRRVFTSAVAAMCVVFLAPLAHAASYTDVVDITFPTEPDAVEYSDDYDAPRSGGRTHKATDLMADKMVEAYAAVGGEIEWIPGAEGEGMPSYGYMIRIAGDDGRSYSYVHMNNDTPGTDDGQGGPENAYAPGLKKGSRVERGQLIGWVGDSGNAEGTAPHIHFEIEDPNVTDPYGTNRMNPYHSLNAALERGDVVDRSSSDAQDDGGEPEPEVDGESAQEPDDEAPAPQNDSGDAHEHDHAEEPSEETPEQPREETPEQPREGTAEQRVELLEDPTASRVAGVDRVGTSVALSQAAFTEASNAVIAPAYAFADAIVAGPLASALGGPVLTTGQDELDKRVLEELERLGVRRVTIVGGEAVLGASVQRELTDAGFDTERLSGERASDTAAVVAERVWEETGARMGDRTALVALGEHTDERRAWPDALAAGWHGAITGRPVLLVTQQSAGASTLDALEGVAEVAVAGGTAAVPDDVTAELEGEGTEVRRLAGADRFATAMAVAEDLSGILHPADEQTLWLATGWEYADAIAAAPALARLDGTMLLVDGSGTEADASLDGYLSDQAGEVDELGVLGGPAAVKDLAVYSVQERLQP